MWSQYLEVGIGPDAEIFTKAPPMAAVGHLAEVGIHPMSTWNNPEPEVVLVANSRGAIVGATLGNDVNLRDVEGRSALLLGKAKDNNASAAIGPFIRLFDADFSLDDVRKAEVGADGRGRGWLPPQGIERHAEDQPRSGRSRRRHDRREPPISRRRGALSRHHVRAGRGPRRARARASPTRSATSSPSPRRGSAGCRTWSSTAPTPSPGPSAPAR